MGDQQFLKRPWLLCLLLVCSGCGFYILNYSTARADFPQVIGLFALLFILYFLTYRLFAQMYFDYLVGAGILFRILLLFSVPNLSEDVYRFIWDGRLAANGINPFLYLPSEIIQNTHPTALTTELYQQLNSPHYYTVYPPVLQAFFWSSAKAYPLDTDKAIVFIKVVILLFEGGTFYLIARLLKKLALPKQLSLLYILNPLVIAELTGNVHFEGVLVFFTLGAVLLLLSRALHASAICLAFAIGTKFLPLLFLPLIFYHLGRKKGLLYSLVTGATALALFVPLFDRVSAQHLVQTVDLFISKFEFNASVYYLVRWVGQVSTGYNLIAWAGPVLSMLAAGFIVSLSFKGRKTEDMLFPKAVIIMGIWFALATTVHPWYICFLLALSVFTPYRFAMVWSFTAALSYAAYRSLPVKENLALIAAGYVLVFGYAAMEVLRHKKQWSSS